MSKEGTLHIHPNQDSVISLVFIKTFQNFFPNCS